MPRQKAAISKPLWDKRAELNEAVRWVQIDVENRSLVLTRIHLLVPVM